MVGWLLVDGTSVLCSFRSLRRPKGRSSWWRDFFTVRATLRNPFPKDPLEDSLDGAFWEEAWTIGDERSSGVDVGGLPSALGLGPSVLSN